MPVGQHQVGQGNRNHSGRYATRHAKEDEEDQLPAVVVHIGVNTRTWVIHQFNMDAEARAICASRKAASRKGAREQRTMGGTYREAALDRKSTRLNSSHPSISYAVFCLKKKKKKKQINPNSY